MTRQLALRLARDLYGPNVVAIGGSGISALVLLQLEPSTVTATLPPEIRILTVLLGVGATWERASEAVESRAHARPKSIGKTA
jgi:hypothetical protein